MIRQLQYFVWPVEKCAMTFGKCCKAYSGSIQADDSGINAVCKCFPSFCF